MLLHTPEARLVKLLGQCYRSPGCLSARRGERLYTTRALAIAASPPRRRAGHGHSKRSGSARSLTTTTATKPEHIAVLGGGITGLAAAAMAARLNPDSKVTLYESSDRLGGYVHSEVVQSSDGPVVFELGPRSLRPTTTRGYYALSLAQNVRLEEQMLFTAKNSPAGSNRFIYYPDRLVRLPHPSDGWLRAGWTLLREPIFEGVPWALWGEHNVPRRPDSLVDESIGDFLKRRCGGNKTLVDNIVSAVIHGIFAGDVNQLSVRSLMPRAWEGEGEHGSITVAMGRAKPEMYGPNNTTSLHVAGAAMLGEELSTKAREAGLYTFKNGMQMLPDALAGVVKGAKNADIKLSTSVSGISRSKDGQTIQIKTSSNQPAQSYSHVISTLPAHRLSHLVDIPALSLIPYTTVMVVNLYYTNPNLVPEPGFGYLIPQSVPFSQNPEFALGVVYDSHATPEVDGSTGTRLTVMIGGHYWDGRSADELPTPEEGQHLAERVLARHLKITDKPDRALATLHKSCIPQYTVGHRERLQSVDAGIRRLFGGRLSVGGAWVDGVGVNDCISSGQFQGISVGKGYTGLEPALENRETLRTMVPPGFLV
ncbi:protoporphyrinogen oxidase [Pseudogymnoascus sp. 23342-1-I1]|nr:protoporphyrinogen oxidase [Pseudogymnoascus sp. 23342-1-I1]